MSLVVVVVAPGEASAMARFLRVSLLVLVLMLLQGAAFLQATNTPDPIHTSVIIIGAGISGRDSRVSGV